MQVFMEIKSAD